MNAQPLFKETGEKIQHHYCGKCGFIRSTKDEAEQCCKPLLCECGNELQQYRNRCNSCIERDSLRKEKNRIMQAERVLRPTVEGRVYWEGAIGDGFIDLSEIESECESEDKELPAFVYDCECRKWEGFDAEAIIEDYFEDSEWFDGAEDQLEAVEEFKEFLASWNKKQTLKQYQTDYYKIIVLDEKQFNAWLEVE